MHDPSVIRVGDRYYVFGSHLAAAWTSDLRNWTQISTDAGAGNTLIPNVRVEMREALEWSDADTFWAPDVIQLGDGKFYLYYCVGRLDAPRSSLGIAVADAVEGPYRNLGILLQSGMWGQPSEDGTIYDATVHPNAVDPTVFFDKEERLWMVYGSYSGGIFIMELDPVTGLPFEGQGYGKHLWGGEHARIEGPYILYHPETDYYYLFVTYGGLAADGGYNMRVARSRTPDGPYLDAKGTDMATVAGAPGTLFDDDSIEPHGVKLMGNYRFLDEPSEPSRTSRGYVSPGHNSAYYDPETGQSYLFFHTRFQGMGELHQVRVHGLYFNENGWPVVSPHRHRGERLSRYQPELFEGSFKLIEHGVEITTQIKQSQLVALGPNGAVSGAFAGSWELREGRFIELELDGVVYSGVATYVWDNDNGVWTAAFSVLSAEGRAVWGSQVASERSVVERWRERHFGSAANAGEGADLVDADEDGLFNLYEYAVGSDPMDGLGRSALRAEVSPDGVAARFTTVFDPWLRYRLLRREGDTSEWVPAWTAEGWETAFEERRVEALAPLEPGETGLLRLEVER